MHLHGFSIKCGGIGSELLLCLQGLAIGGLGPRFIFTIKMNFSMGVWTLTPSLSEFDTQLWHTKANMTLKTAEIGGGIF